MAFFSIEIFQKKINFFLAFWGVFWALTRFFFNLRILQPNRATNSARQKRQYRYPVRRLSGSDIVDHGKTGNVQTYCENYA